MSLFGKFWDRIAPTPNDTRGEARAGGAAAGGSADIDNAINSQIRPGEPGLAIAVMKGGVVYFPEEVHHALGIEPFAPAARPNEGATALRE